MHKKFEINLAKIKGGCQSGRKVVPHDSKSDLRLVIYNNFKEKPLKNKVVFLSRKELRQNFGQGGWKV